MKKKVHVGHRPTQRKQMFFWTIFLLVTLFSVIRLEFDGSILIKGFVKISGILAKMMKISWDVLPKVMESMIFTLTVAVLGVIISAAVALVIGFLIAMNTAPNKYVRGLLISVCTVIRTIPMTVWVLLAVASAGFGATAAVLGMALPTIAYLSKTFANQIEGCGNGVKEAMTAMGTSWLVMIMKGYIPMCKTSLLAVAAFRLEMSVSESTVLGLVGCGGIGYMISRYIKAYKFGELSTCLLVVLAVMYLMEIGTSIIRKRLRKNNG